MTEGRQSEDETNRLDIPPGMKLLRTLEGHQNFVWSVASSPDGRWLASGSDDNTLPPCLHDQVFCDFRKEEDYFITAFDLILSLYGIAPSDPAVAHLAESFGEPRMR
jgi:WD40 repeat protein